MKKKDDNNAVTINTLITHKNNYNKKKTLLSEGLICNQVLLLEVRNLLS